MIQRNSSCVLSLRPSTESDGIFWGGTWECVFSKNASKNAFFAVCCLLPWALYLDCEVPQGTPALAVVCKGSHSALGTWYQHVGATHRERAVKIIPPASQAVVSKTSDSFFESHHSTIYKPYDFLS